MDDLERIEGVGPKLAAALRAAGLRTYAAVADADVATLEQAIEDAGVRFAPSLRTWSRQARLLADGDEEGFQELIGRLVAGREVTPATAKPAPAPADSAPAPAEAESEPADSAPADAEPAAFAPDAAGPASERAAFAPADAEPAAESTAAEEAGVADADAEAEGAEPELVLVAASVPVRDDDLKRIEGIGPRMSGALVAAGIRTFQQLAGADEATIRAAIEAAGLRFAPSLTTWARQAQLLADGDEDGFADLTRRLVAGRDVGRV